ncbi:hypothetical protein KLP40_19660 [Hymenobacter sp. NST-14]|uniref:hypothetical protein n=1 Tax=Hymenobacter piscis TaxID=2839984 RepID=UPI001C03277B|nr:hypothetical protein [Hymenobacter piscis]MBT9395392.1 hypothetical protein [Hymenobacter piscis]
MAVMLPTVGQPALAVELIPPARVVTFRLAEAAGFEVPQVALPNPVAARRINRAIVQQVLVGAGKAGHAGWEPGPALRRIRGACCREENGHRQPGQSLMGEGYRVLRSGRRAAVGL